MRSWQRLGRGHLRGLCTDNPFAALAADLAGPAVAGLTAAWRRPGMGNWCPADAILSLPAGRHSRTLAKLACLEAARGSFDGAHAAITRRCGKVIGKRQVEDSVVHAAADIAALYASSSSSNTHSEPDRQPHSGELHLA